MVIKNMVSGHASAKYVCTSPIKIRRVLNQVRGCMYEDALVLLEFLPYNACEPVWNVIKSAAANVQNLYGINKKTPIFIDEIFVTPGPILKRFKTRAQGRAYKIHKPTCHITAVVSIKK
jgi:large subunit ribosomal protein L22